MVKVGDRIRVLDDSTNQLVKAGDEFIVRNVYESGSVDVEGEIPWRFSTSRYKIVANSKDPIEYLKTAHANSDTINPETMLRECYGITKTERVVTEWTKGKREIKVGDKVRIIGNSIIGYEVDRRPNGSIHAVTRVDKNCTEYPYSLGGVWFPASSVELV